MAGLPTSEKVRTILGLLLSCILLCIIMVTRKTLILSARGKVLNFSTPERKRERGRPGIKEDSQNGNTVMFF